jgi:cyclopropane fatty-acyl-phospholipid synthase-like methyltransferase
MRDDVMGSAMENYFGKNDNTPIRVFINKSEEPEMYPSVFFRPYKNMLKYEKIALKNSKGKVLDLGCGAGCHSLYLQNKGFDVTAVEVSKKSANVALSQGVNKVINEDWRNLNLKNFDTVLVLMNGMGLAESPTELKLMFRKLKSFLSKTGSILIDSTDVTYAKADWPMLDSEYFGKVQFELKYKGKTQCFPWLFVDFETAVQTAKSVKLNVEVLERARNGHFLLRLSKMS